VNGLARMAGEPFVVDLTQTGLPAEVVVEVTARDGVTTRTYTLGIVDTASWVNVALNKPVETNTEMLAGFPPENAVDGVITQTSRWITAESSVAPQWLVIDLQGTHTLRAATVVNGHMTSNGWYVKSFYPQSWDGNGWVDIPGASVSENNARYVEFVFPGPVVTNRVRFVSNDNSYVRVMEIEIYAQP
jgi:acyl dehydratase